MFHDVNGNTIHPSVKRLLELPYLEQRSEAWFAARAKMTITGRVPSVYC